MNKIPETKSRKGLLRLTAVELEMRLYNIAIGFSVRPLIDITTRLLTCFLYSMVSMRGIIAFVILRARKSKLFFGRQ